MTTGKQPYFRKATRADIDWIASRLREADLQEIKAICNESPRLVLLAGYNASVPRCWAICDKEDNPVALFGLNVSETCEVAPVAIWLLGTPGLSWVKIPFLRQCRGWLDTLQETHPLLYNYVDARNTLHIKWLRWLGFTFIRRIDHHGMQRLPFYEFVRIPKTENVQPLYIAGGDECGNQPLPVHGGEEGRRAASRLSK